MGGRHGPLQRSPRALRAALLCVCVIAAAGQKPMDWRADGRLRLSSTHQDNAVLQWNSPCLWGWVDDAAKAPSQGARSVTVSCRAEGCSASGLVSAETGEWRVCLPPQPPGGPTTVAVEARAGPLGTKGELMGRVELSNVLFGDVWLVAGQSNMHFTVRWRCASYLIVFSIFILINQFYYFFI